MGAGVAFTPGFGVLWGREGSDGVGWWVVDGRMFEKGLVGTLVLPHRLVPALN